MFYLHLLSSVLGLVLLAAGGFAYWKPDAAMRFLLERFWPEKKSKMLVLLAGVLILLTLVCWVVSAAHLNAYGLMLTGFLTLFCIKAVVILAVYGPFRKAVVMLLTTEKTAFLFVIISTLAIGAGFLILGSLIGK